MDLRLHSTIYSPEKVPVVGTPERKATAELTVTFGCLLPNGAVKDGSNCFALAPQRGTWIEYCQPSPAINGSAKLGPPAPRTCSHKHQLRGDLEITNNWRIACELTKTMFEVISEVTIPSHITV